MQVTYSGKDKDPAWGEPPPWRTPEFWDQRASSFAEHDKGSGYADAFMKIIAMEPDWNVLDVGSATGTLAIPLAKKAKSITALDFSGKMLELLRKRCDDSGVDNIRTVHGRWEDDWQSLGIIPHDVVIASRSMPLGSARTAIAKLNEYARRRVYAVVAAGNGPRDSRVYEAIGRDFNPPSHYGEINLMLTQLGLCASNAFISYEDTSSYENHEEAFESLNRSIPDISTQEEEKLKSFLRQNLVLKDGRWKLFPVREIRWAVIWWDKDRNKEEVMSSITAEI
ncbi:MAG: methyltransferase domain-containing protein [Geobacteraceae bacterium]|nr:methyltransferase domain-containing protein [Geobacteraceae bacterium]